MSDNVSNRYLSHYTYEDLQEEIIQIPHYEYCEKDTVTFDPI